MNSFVTVFRAWAKDPFGKKKEVDKSRKILIQMAETKVQVKDVVDRKENQQQLFPISHMITNSHTKNTTGRG